MSRMLKALQEIETRLPESRPTVRPLASEELEAFGLRQSPVCETPQPPQAEPAVPDAESVGPPEPAAPQEADTHVASTESAKPLAAQESDRPVRRLLGPRDEEHQGPYRELARNILAELPADRPAVLMFTSPDGEGTIGVVAALAVALAEQLAEDVVVVDANLRSPGLANDFGIWADHGLIDVLGGEIDWRQALRKTSAKHLSVLPGGRPTGDDGAWPEPPTLGSLLQTLRRSHRLVLVDTASLLYPEVAPLSGLCDGTYLVAALGQTGRDAARQAARLIKRRGGRLLGCVLANAPAAP
jgi:Mrp family chromosome partitioning ATPase